MPAQWGVGVWVTSRSQVENILGMWGRVWFRPTGKKFSNRIATGFVFKDEAKPGFLQKMPLSFKYLASFMNILWIRGSLSDPCVI